MRARKVNSLLLVGAIPPPQGGVAIHISRFLPVLRASGIEVSVLDESRKRKPSVENLRHISPWAYLQLMRSNRLVYVHSSNHYVRLLHTLVALACGARVLHFVHSSRGVVPSLAALKIATMLGQECIGVSEAVAARLGGRPHIIPAFIPPEPAEQELKEDVAVWIAQQKKLGRKVIAFNAFCPARLNGTDLYGLDMIVAAFTDSAVRSRFAAVLCVSTFNSCEEEAYFQEIRHRVSESAASDHIRLFIGDRKFAAVLRQCNLFVRPTSTDGDSISLREALWYGIPAIASDAAVRPEGSIVFPSRNLNEFIAAILGAPESVKPVGTGREFADNIVAICTNLLAA